MYKKSIIIKSFNGIGDLLFVTPSLKKIREYYPQLRILVNTNYPELLENNPYVDKIGKKNKGLFLGYPDPIHCVNPLCHHILSDYKIIKEFYNLTMLPHTLTEDEISPSIYFSFKKTKVNKIGVQILHKGQWNKKKVWPYFSDLIKSNPQLFESIPKCNSIQELTSVVASYKGIICTEGGISHLAKATNTPAIVIYGGFANPEWNGYRSQVNICCKMECSYCYNSYKCVSKKEERECMRNISISHITTTATKFFKKEKAIDE